MAAYAQKLARAGKLEDDEIPKATKSVVDVTVILVPARASARAHRFPISSLFSEARGPFLSRLKAFTITKASSTPIPSKINGKRECTGPKNRPQIDDKPSPAAVLSLGQVP